MKKKYLVGLGLMVVSAGAWASSEVTLSGYVDLSVEYLQDSGSKSSRTRMSSGGLNNSRINISGTTTLPNENEAFFTLEPSLQANNGTWDSQFRQAFVGLRGAWGDLSFGRQFTPSYWIAGYSDPNWASAYSMMNSMVWFLAPFRKDNAVKFNTPRSHGFMGRFMYGFGDEGSKGGLYGGNNSDPRNLGNDGRFYSVGVDYRKGSFFIGAAYEKQYKKELFTGRETSAYDNYLSVAYRMGSIEPTFVYHTYNGYYSFPPYIGFKSKGWSSQLGVRWNINDNNNFHFSYLYRHDNNKADIGSANGVTTGITHGFSKNVDGYFLLSHVWNDKNVPVPYPVTFVGDAFPQQGQSPTGVALGLRYGFD